MEGLFILVTEWINPYLFQLSKRRAAELMLEGLKQLAPVASATLPKPRKPVVPKKKTRNLIKVPYVFIPEACLLCSQKRKNRPPLYLENLRQIYFQLFNFLVIL